MDSKVTLTGHYLDYENQESSVDREILVQLKPPIGKKDTLSKISVIAVVDCSGSMSGNRERKANKIVQTIFDARNVERLEVIKFGSSVQGPFCYDKQKTNIINIIAADLGGTDFIIAMKLLLKTLKVKTPEDNCVVVFLSDGEASPPTDLYEPVKEELVRIGAPLLSIAISHNVNPEIMVTLANLNGNLGLCLVKDSQAESEYMDELIAMLPIGFPIDILKINVKNSNNTFLTSLERRYKRGSDLITFNVQGNVPIKSLHFEGELEGVVYPISLIDIRDTLILSERLERISAYISSACKAAMGQYIVKAITREEGCKQIKDLRAIYSKMFDITQILPQESENANQETPATKLERLKMRRAYMTFYHEALQNLNTYEAAFQNPDLKVALEAYSGQAVSAKFNRRLLEVAAKNKTAEGIDISEEHIKAYLTSDTKPVPQCLYWLQNQFEDAAGQLSEIDPSEWVGHGVLVSVDRSVSLNAWNLAEVTFRPLKITNNVIHLIKNKEFDNPKNIAQLNGFEGEFNSSLPLLSPDEHTGTVRLIIEFMRNNSEAKKAVSKLLTNTEELFDAAMINALYVAGTINTLLVAQTGIEFELAFKAFLTLVDQNLTGSPLHKPATDYWEGFLGDLLSQEAPEANVEEKDQDGKVVLTAKTEVKGNNLIGSKESKHLPNIARAFIPLTCTERAYQTPLSEINQLFAKLFVRLVVDQTSGQYLLNDLLVLPHELISTISQELIAKNTTQIPPLPEQPFLANTSSVKLYTNRLRAMYYIHIAVREFLQERNISFTDFFNGVLKGSISLEGAKNVFKHAQELVKQGLSKFVATIFNTTKPDTIISELIVVACQKHISTPLPNHDGNDIKTLLNSFNTLEELNKLAVTVFQQAMRGSLSKVLSHVESLIAKRTAANNFIARARDFDKKYPLECLELNLENSALSYTNNHSIFQSRLEMFSELRYSDFLEEDLADLEKQSLSYFDNFDLNKWMREHSGFTFGLSKFYKQHLSTSVSKDEYYTKVEKDLIGYYNGEHGDKYKRPFIPQIKFYSRVSTDHFFEEYHLMKQIQELKKKGISDEAIYQEVVATSAEIAALSHEKAELRRLHVKNLIPKIDKDAPIL